LSVRRPVVSGAFYPSEPETLNSRIEDCFTHELGPGTLPDDGMEDKHVISLVSPHAGYIYSGPVAAHGYLHLSRQKAPETIILIGPNHTGLGKQVSMWGEGAWQTPLGEVPVDEKLCKELGDSSENIEFDEMGHLREHSIEVQLPFLQYIFDDFKIVPLCMGSQNIDLCIDVGESIAESKKNKDILLIASTDLTHQEPQKTAEEKDRLVIDSIIDMDARALHEKVRKNRITMCGYGPVSSAIMASKNLGANRADLLSYQTSGDITGDTRAVVGYASIKLTL